MTSNRHTVDTNSAPTSAQWKRIQSERHFRDLIEHTSDWIWEVDERIRYTYASPRIYDLLGYTVDEVVGKSPFDFMPLEEAVRVRADVEELIRNPQPFQALQNVNLHKDGSLRTLESSGVPMRDAEGRFVGFRGIDRDITERKKVERALQEAMARSAQEKARSEAIIAAIGEGLVIVDRDYKILYQNQILRDLAGDALGGHCYAVYGARENLCENCPVAATFADGEIHTTERSASTQGETVYREITASPLRDESGAIIAGIELVRDITERKLAEHALQESERQMKEVQRIAQLGSWQFDYLTGSLTWSDETYRILGLAPKQVPASYQAFLAVVHPDDREQVARRYRQSLQADSNGYETEHRIVRTVDGTVRHVHQKCEHLKDESGRVVRSYGMVHDITPHKDAEKRIRNLNGTLSERAVELERANKDLEAFSYTVSHDLRGPLTNINSYCQAIVELAADRLDSQCKGFLTSVFEEIGSMDGLITSLLNLSRFSHVKLSNRQVDLSEMARMVAAELRVREPARRVRFEIEEGIFALGDEKLLRMVLMNLLGNAWKFSAHREDPVIRIGTTRRRGHQTYYVSDNGIGFAMSDSDKIFAVFQRLHRNEEFEGYGIGLTTVQRIVERHHGRIWAEGEPGKGATFFFTLHEKLPLVAPETLACAEAAPPAAD